MNDFTQKWFNDRWEKIHDVGKDFPDECPRKIRKNQCSFWLFKQVLDDGKILYGGTLKFREKGKYVYIPPSIDLYKVIFEGISKMEAHYGST